MPTSSARSLLYFMASIPLLYILYLAQQPILLVSFATLLAIGLAHLVTFLSCKLSLSYGKTFLGLLASVLVVLGALSWVVVPQLQQEVRDFTETVQQFESSTLTQSLPIPERASKEIRNVLQSSNSQIVSQIQSAVSSSVTFFSYLLVVLFIILYGAWQYQTYQTVITNVLQPLPKKYTDVVETGVSVTNKWLLGRVYSMVIVGGLTYVGLLLLGISSPLFLAVTAGLLSFVPNLGPLLSAVPAMLIAASGGFESVGLVIGLYAGIQFVESYFITPTIQNNLISVPPALLLAVQLILGTVFGILGLLLAAPLTAIVIGIGTQNVSTTNTR